MRSSKSHRVVFVTCGTLTEARRIARKVVGARLAACVSILLGPVESVYRWKGAVENAREILLVIKTTRSRLAALEEQILKLHSYDVPEFIVLPIVAGSRPYLDWLDESVSAPKRTARK